MKKYVFIISIAVISLYGVDKPLMFSQPAMQSDTIVTAPAIESPTQNKQNIIQPVNITSKNIAKNVATAKENFARAQGKSTYIKDKDVIRITVTGLGVAPSTVVSKAQSYALAKRAAITDAYRLLAEKVNGVNIVGEDTVKNAIVTKTTVRTEVDALISKATILDTRFKNGLCEVDLELLINVKEWSKKLSKNTMK